MRLVANPLALRNRLFILQLTVSHGSVETAEENVRGKTVYRNTRYAGKAMAGTLHRTNTCYLKHALLGHQPSMQLCVNIRHCASCATKHPLHPTQCVGCVVTALTLTKHTHSYTQEQPYYVIVLP